MHAMNSHSHVEVYYSYTYIQSQAESGIPHNSQRSQLVHHHHNLSIIAHGGIILLLAYVHGNGTNPVMSTALKQRTLVLGPARDVVGSKVTVMVQQLFSPVEDSSDLIIPGKAVVMMLLTLH